MRKENYAIILLVNLETKNLANKFALYYVMQYNQSISFQEM